MSRTLRTVLLILVLPVSLVAQRADSLAVARRVVAATSLAAKEYALGVAPGGGRVIQVEELEETRLFLANARADASKLPVSVRAAADSGIGELLALVARLVPPAELEERADALTHAIAAAVGGGLDPTPRRPPSLARGQVVYGERCAACHGSAGRGDGPQAAAMRPAPANLADPAAMAGVAAVDIYRRVSIGVPGTAMPGYESLLNEEDRWAVTAYVATLQYGGSATRAAFASVRRLLDSALAQRSPEVAFETYLAFEQVEAELRVRDPVLARSLEAEFATLRARAATADAAALDSMHSRLLAGLERAERAVADRPSNASLFAQSFFLLTREGFEAILILAALLAFLTKAGAPEQRRHVTHGAVWAVAASLATWGLIEWIFEISPAQREGLEGVTMLLATAVLFYVSYWLLSKIEVAKWTAFVKERMTSALAAGSGLALGSVAFLAVYREGLETILFYKALFATGGAAGAAAVLTGMAAGGVALVGIYLAIHWFGLKIPTKPFFAATSGILYFMAFVFAGKGIAELQEAGWIGIKPVAWMPRIPELGIYPTMESLSLQVLLLALALFALVWMQRRPAERAAVSSK